MDIIQILQRSLSGYAFVLPMAALYFFMLKKLKKPLSRAHIAASLVFLYYLVGVFTMTGIGRLKPFSPRLVLVPFRDMIGGPVDTLLNVLLFVPLGIFLPIMYKRFNKLNYQSLSTAVLIFTLAVALVIFVCYKLENKLSEGTF